MFTFHELYSCFHFMNNTLNTSSYDVSDVTIYYQMKFGLHLNSLTFEDEKK
jgi:hypothetical protein